MSIFARATFSAAGYAAFRPSYPASLFRTVLHYYNPDGITTPSGTVLDLGCGHGLVARALAPHFSRAIGIDPSAGMVAQATEMTASAAPSHPELERVSFRQGAAEDLGFLPAGAVDLAVAGQAAHWFDQARAWPELARVVRRGGALAFWGYKDNVLVGHPAATAVVERFCYADGEVAPGLEGMRRFWEQPGRGVLRDYLRAVVPPAGEWEQVRRLVYDPDPDMAAPPPEGSDEAAWLRKRMRLGEYERYIRTFSAFGGWRDAHSERKSRADGGEGDVVDVMFDHILEAVPEWKALGDGWREAEVEAVWGTVILMARRRDAV